MREKSGKIMWILSGILVVVSVFVILKTHRLIPFMMDDLWYSTMLYDDTPISSLADIVKSQIWHYNNWGGRSMTHAILQLTLLAGETAADILNVIMTFLLAGMICMVAENRRFPAFFAASGMLLGLNANWKMSMFWQAGAANYLYITVFLLAYVFCYLRELSDKREPSDEQTKIKRLPGITFWMIPLGVLAGWSNENMGPAVWLLSLAVMVINRREKKKIPVWMVLGNISCLFGSIMVIVAPGNFVRSAEVPENQYGFLWRCFLRGYAECKGALEYLFPTLLILAFLLMMQKCVLKEQIGRRSLLLMLCALLSWGAMALSPHYPDRAAFGTMALLICVIISLAGKILRVRRDMAWPLFGAAFLVWLRGMYFCGEFIAISWGWIK
ncbi:MAG: DUF6056 family protein [Acetatifactor sp.]